MDWKTNREAQDATAAWAIPHLRGIPKEERLNTLTMLIVNHKLDLTAEELNRWCHRYEQPDIASGLVNKDTEGQAAIIEHRAITQAAEPVEEEAEEENEAAAGIHRAEGFRTFAELVAPEAETVTWHYPADIRVGAAYLRDSKGKRLSHMRSKKVGKGAAWKCIEGSGTVTLSTGERVAFLTSCTVGIREGEIIWALPEVGPKRIWERRKKGRDGLPGPLELNYHQKVISRGINPKVIGIRALGLARRHAPGVLSHSEGAELAKQLGLKSRQLLHYHETGIEQEIVKRVRHMRTN